MEQWVDFGRIPRRRTQGERLKRMLDVYPCDVLFVHRDAEAQLPEWRREEIARLLQDTRIRHIPVVPVRMTEAWLLANEYAIRCAAGNPNGTEDLRLPDIGRLEALPNPKGVLHEALINASGRNSRRRSRISPERLVHLIPHYIDDYSSLRALKAFRELQDDIQSLSGSNPQGYTSDANPVMADDLQRFTLSSQHHARRRR